MTKRCLITNPVSNANLLVGYLKAQGVDCYAVIEMDKVSRMPSLSEKKKGEFNAELYHGIFISAEQVPGPEELPFDIILAGSENGVALAERLSQRHGLAGNDPAHSGLRRHKDAMHRALAQAGLAAIPTCVLDGLSAALSLLPCWEAYPCVFKPQSSAGGEGVVFCRNRIELEQAFLGADWGGFSSTWSNNDCFVLQPFITGKEYVVDMVAQAGKYVVSSVCRYIRCDELGIDSCPFVKKFTFLLDPNCERLRALVAYAQQAACALGIHTGAIHMELLDSPAGPVMIEVGARLHGTITPALFEHCYDPHLLSQLYATSFARGEVGSARLIRRGIISDVISMAPGVFNGANEALAPLESFIGLQASVEVGERFKTTSDLFSSSMNAAFSHQDETVLWDDLAVFERWTETVLNGATLTPAAWQFLRNEYRAYF
ncbi:ATP-grasp domain-containing protein [Pseudomonas palleroniana]|uniref:ATP-grasp domain-containing protein n=1 Tax=Pseudomonas palleroniana TaxID=191390 RepID=A0A1H5N8X3_9PSED|nr:ATP-grasp domain-containing protein [Pseudomonas palleroniana]KAB0569729.1 ATP-grasp domain-containing protein [Pseudomonas palleroniana]PTC31251.1 ATP-grasp domain-containing protein [Pseudomonas palleroniana]SEE97307.1 ATP-grasp domain-containing protein [Pseudomonas palleroniana]